jgi:hypothetical protein
MEKLVFLSPGRYTLTSSLTEEVQSNAPSFRWELRCVAGNSLLLQASADKRGETILRFDVPSSCRASRFALVVDHEGPQPASVTVMEPKITKASE